MGLRNKLRPGSVGSGRASVAVIDFEEFVSDSEDPQWQESLAAARHHVVDREGGVAVIDHDEFLEDSNDPDWRDSLVLAREHVDQLERAGRSR